MQRRFSCVLTCATLIVALATVSRAHPHLGSSVDVAGAYISKSRASNRQAGPMSFLVRLKQPLSSSDTKSVNTRRLLVMLLSGNPSALCRLLGNLQDFVFPWNDMDVFVFSDNNAAAENTGCGNRVRTCDLAAPDQVENCTAADTNVFYLPLREEWRTPTEAGGSHTWQTWFSEGYRRMVCPGALLDTSPHHELHTVWFK